MAKLILKQLDFVKRKVQSILFGTINKIYVASSFINEEYNKSVNLKKKRERASPR